MHVYRIVSALLIVTIGGGCSSSKTVQPNVDVQTIVADEAEQATWPSSNHPAVDESVKVELERMKATPPGKDYVVGPNDVLYINIYGKPEWSSPVHIADGRILGTRVDGQGNIQLPKVGKVNVNGMTRLAVQERLNAVFKEHLVEPWVVVEMASFRSQPIYLIGRFKRPGVQYMDRPINIAQAVALAGGVDSSGYLRGMRVIRDEQVLPVDVYALLREGQLDQNIWLRPNDTIYVPDSDDNKVFVVGGVAKPGVVDMIHGRLTLNQALSNAGGFLETGRELEQARIIRSISPTRGELITVNLKRIIEGAAVPFMLAPGDIVYIPQNELGEWNSVVKEILPSLQLVGATLQPFVQIRFLTRD